MFEKVINTDEKEPSFPKTWCSVKESLKPTKPVLSEPETLPREHLNS